MKPTPNHHSSFNLHTFFSKFDLFADAPGAVAKMRELVLKLAVRGKLVEQEATGESLTEAQRHGGVRDEDEMPYPLPAGWRWEELGTVARLRRGYDLPTQARKPGSIPIFAANGPVGVHESHMVKGPGVVTGRSGSIGKVHFVEEDYWPLNTALYVEDFFGNYPQFICLLLRSLHLEQYSTATAVPTLNRNVVHRELVRVPPLAEQKRIVAKVDELMALCDRLEAQQQEREQKKAALARASLARFAAAPTPSNLDMLFYPPPCPRASVRKSGEVSHRGTKAQSTSSFLVTPTDLRKSILTLAVQGKLVPQNPNDDPAEDSFPKLASMAVESDDEFPARWLRVPLGKMGEWRGGGTPSKSHPEFWKGDLPWVSPKDMKVLHIADAQDHISPAAVEGSSVRLIPPGSVLMVVRGMILARAFPVALTMREVTINQDMKALLPSDRKAKEYLLLALRAFEPDVLAAIEHSSHGTCKLKTEFLQSFTIPIPPLAEQRRIVAKVDELMALVDELETQLASARAAAANLLTALVAELTGQG